MDGFVIVRTVGDLWKALSGGLTPAIGDASAFEIKRGPNLPELTFPRKSDQRNWNVLDAALSLVDAEGGDRAEAMRKLIARVAVQRGMTRRAVINSPLADFVAALQQQAKAAAKPRNTAEEYNIEARKYLRTHPDAGPRELQAALGCGMGTVYKLAAYQAVAAERKKGRKPKAVSLTKPMADTATKADGELAKLVREQRRDARTHKVSSRERL